MPSRLDGARRVVGRSRLMEIDDETTPITHPADWVPPPAREPRQVSPRMPWTYDQSDPALMLFTAAVQRFNLTFRPGSRIAELGCAESDWLERMHRWDPSFDLIGVDARAQGRPADGFTLVQGSAMDPTLFEPQSLDWVVLLGALEHFGLGFYGDAEDPDGDIVTMQQVARWLRPGGFVYFDVPCQPTYRIAENRHFRSYSPAAVSARLVPPTLQEINRAYSLPEPHAGTWCHVPTVDRVPYWFVAVLCQRCP